VDKGFDLISDFDRELIALLFLSQQVKVYVSTKMHDTIIYNAEDDSKVINLLRYLRIPFVYKYTMTEGKIIRVVNLLSILICAKFNQNLLRKWPFIEVNQADSSSLYDEFKKMGLYVSGRPNDAWRQWCFFALSAGTLHEEIPISEAMAEAAGTDDVSSTEDSDSEKDSDAEVVDVVASGEDLNADLDETLEEALDASA